MTVRAQADKPVAVTAPAQRFERPSLRALAPFGAAAAVVLAAWVVIGLPASAVVAGVIAWYGVSTRLLHTTEATGWAAAVAVEASALVGLLLVTPALPYRLTAAMGWVVLVLPLVTPLVLLFLFRGRGLMAAEGARVPAPVIALGCLAVARWVQSGGPGHGIAWVMSGDARNHVLLSHGVVDAGGITVSGLRGYPLVGNALSALLAAADGRDGLAAGSLLMQDLKGLAALYVLIAMALGLLLACALAEALHRTVALEVQRGPVLPAVLVGAALLPLTGVVSAIPLRDGFMTAYMALALLLAVLVLAMSAASTGDYRVLLVGAALVPLQIGVWPIAALVSAGVVGAAAAAVLTLHPRAVLRQILVIALLATAPIVFLVNRAVLVPTLAQSGTITAPEGWLLAAPLAIATGWLILSQRGATRRTAAVATALPVAGFLVIRWLMGLGSTETRWTYYSWKTLWLLESASLWMLLLPAAWLACAHRLPRVPPAVLIAARAALAAVLAFAAFRVVGAGTTPPAPMDQARDGWVQPAAGSVDALRRWGDTGGPYVFWHWYDGGTYTAEDRIANFWAVATWIDNVHPPAGFSPISWAYTAAGEAKDFCDLGRATPPLRVVTRDPAVTGQLSQTCPEVQFVVSQG